MNDVKLMGNLTRDPELKTLQSGSCVVNFGIAVNGQRYKDKTTGESKQDVSFVDCEAWAKTAEVINEYFSKGKPIIVDGELKQDNWEDADGEKRSKIKVRVNKFYFLPRNEATVNGGAAPQASKARKPKGKQEEPVAAGNDIPF